MGRLVLASFVSCAPERGTSGTLQLTRRLMAKETIICWSALCRRGPSHSANTLNLPASNTIHLCDVVRGVVTGAA